MKTLELLKRARKRITNRRHWTRGAFARRKGGYWAQATAPDATRWCAVGALMAETAILSERLRAERLLGSIIALNDTKGHAAVLARFDKAIAKLEKRNAD